MILKSLKLNNIRSYIDEKIVFPEGSVLLSGDIGSGKSTILLAIEFALFGLRRSHLPGNALLRNGKNEGSVELSFSINNQDITIKRTLKRQRADIQQSSGYIIQNNLKTEATAVELKAKILDVLGYPKSELTKSKDLIYRYTVYTPQEHMKHILLEPAELRLDTLRKVFNIDKYKRIRENSARVIRFLKDRINIYTGNVEDLEDKKRLKENKDLEIKNLNEQLEFLRPKIDSATKDVDNKRLQLESTEKDINIANMLKQELNLNEARLQEILRQRSLNNQQLENLAKEIFTLQGKISGMHIIKPENKKDEIEKKIVKSETELLKISKQKTELVEKSKYNEQRMQELEKEISDKTERSRNFRVMLKEIEQAEQELKAKKLVEHEVKELEKSIAQLEKDIHEKQIKKNSSEEVKQKIRKLENCPTCQQAVTKEHKLRIIDKENLNIDSFDLELKNAKTRLDEFQRKFEQGKQKFNELLDKEKHLDILKVETKNLKSLNKEVVEKQKAYSEISLEKIKIDYELEVFDEDKINSMKTELDGLKMVLKRIIEYELKLKERQNYENLIQEKSKNKENLENIQEDMKKEIGNINMKKQELNAEVSKYKEIEEKLQKIKMELLNLQNIEKELLLEKRSYETQMQTIDKNIQELNEEIRHKQEIKSKIKILTLYRNWFEQHFIKLMLVIEKHLMSTVYQEFNELLQKWFNTLIEDETINIRLNEEFTPLVEQNGYEVAIENLSGGEKTAASLAYRLALNKVVNDVQAEIKTKDIIILDEPTDGFSSAQLDKVRDVLDQIDIKQVILVSHESKIESFVDNIIRINKNEHISQIIF
ncbi:SMC family ATPase [Candidatus Woesearchaeota archaeon]|nr:SMC family ATPase [Candidatus Woesearchaeota archaeon]